MIAICQDVLKALSNMYYRAFATIVSESYFRKNAILVVWQSSKYASDMSDISQHAEHVLVVFVCS